MGLFIRPNYRPFAPLRQALIFTHFPRIPPRLTLSRSCLPPRLQHEAAGAVFSELGDLLFLEHAEGFAGEIRAVNVRWVEAGRFAEAVTDSNLCLVLLNGKDIAAIEKNASTIVDVFNREAAHAMKLKALDL
jgi:hypothetical protein